MLPVETILAVFPSAVAIGNVRLQPLTLYHAVALEFFGVDLNGECDAGNAYAAAWILAKTPEAVRDLMCADVPSTDGLADWMDGLSASVSEMVEGVNRCINMAFAPNVPGQNTSEVYHSGPTGYGWPLELAEALCHEYALSFDAAMSMPLSRAFGMMACGRTRNGGKAGGPDYYERIILPQMMAAKPT